MCICAYKHTCTHMTSNIFLQMHCADNIQRMSIGTFVSRVLRLSKSNEYICKSCFYFWDMKDN